MPRDTNEIGVASVVKPPRRRRASSGARTIGWSPSVAPIGEGAIRCPITTDPTPHSPTLSGGQSIADNQATRAASERGAIAESIARSATPLAQIIPELVEAQKQRVFCIKSQSRIDRACEAFIARHLGYGNDLDEKERKVLFARAAAMRKQVEKGGQFADVDHESVAPADGEGQSTSDDQSKPALSVCTPIILNSQASRIAWDSHRNQVEKRMRKLAHELPVWAWADNVAGLGELGVAIIAAEAGAVGTYATKERLWKRLGLAVIEGERQQRRTNAEQAAAHGYNPRRRAEIWTIADSMFKHQWRGEKDDIPAHAVGAYGEVYGHRKAHTESRDWTLKHRDNDARRVMTKALVEDFWRVWRGLDPLAPYVGPRPETDVSREN